MEQGADVAMLVQYTEDFPVYLDNAPYGGGTANLSALLKTFSALYLLNLHQIIEIEL